MAGLSSVRGYQRFHSAAGQPGGTSSGRLLPGCDLLRGIIDMGGAHEVRPARPRSFVPRALGPSPNIS
jgi:hypothetical protein